MKKLCSEKGESAILIRTSDRCIALLRRMTSLMLRNRFRVANKLAESVTPFGRLAKARVRRDVSELWWSGWMEPRYRGGPSLSSQVGNYRQLEARRA